MRSHGWIDERSLALHAAVADRLESEPKLISIAHENLKRWLIANPAAALGEWQKLLDKMSLPEVLELLRSRSERAARLRQSSPFAGLLTSGERQAILAQYESRRT